MLRLLDILSGRLRLATVLVALWCAVLPVSQALAADCAAEPQRLQLVLSPSGSIEALQQVYPITAVDSLPPYYLCDVAPGTDVDALILILSTDPMVDAVEPAFLIDIPEGTRQMMVAAVGGTIEGYRDQHASQRIHLPEAHAHALGDGVRVAILDTGVSSTHSAFLGAIAAGGFDFVDGDSIPEDTAGGVDDDGDGLTDEGAGHGTMSAGVVLLVAPGAKLLPYRVLDDEGRGRSFDVVKALHTAADAGADVINLSLGLDCVSQLIAREIARVDSLGISLAAAAGNDNREEPPTYPASDPRVLSVTALDSLDVKAEFSNYHDSVDLSAPGVGILGPYYDGDWAYGAGTSFAAPFVSGQLALVRALNPEITKADVDSLCRIASVDVDTLPGNEVYAGKLGRGRLDAFLAWQVTPIAASAPIAAYTNESAWIAIPNPSRAGTTVQLFPRKSAKHPAIATVHDACGRQLARLLPDSNLGWIWNGLDSADRPVPAGIYFVSFSAAPILSNGDAPAGFVYIVRLSR